MTWLNAATPVHLSASLFSRVPEREPVLPCPRARAWSPVSLSVSLVSCVPEREPVLMGHGAGKTVKPRVKLVVTGDDFGYCPRRNQGLVDCFLAGGVSNVSLLVNGSAAQDAAELAKRHRIPIGLHANLSEGVPVCQGLRRGSTLLNHHGFFLGKMGFRRALQHGQLSLAEVELELRAQVRLFGELMGHLPGHMDGHQHVHVLPEVRDVFAQVLSDCCIPFTRVPVEPGLLSCPWLSPPLRDFYCQVEKDALEAVPVFRRHGIRWPDVYVGLTTMGRNMSVLSLKRALTNAMEASPLAPPSGAAPAAPTAPLTAELMVHPGYPSCPGEGGCGEGPDDFSRSADRQHELTALTDAAVLALYAQEGVQICAFKDL